MNKKAVTYIKRYLYYLSILFWNGTFGISSIKSVSLSISMVSNIQIPNLKRGGRVKFATHFYAKFQLSCSLLFSTENISIVTRFSPHLN